MGDVKVEIDGNNVNYTSVCDITPFKFSVFPQDKDLFHIIIASNCPDIICKNVLTYVLNSFVEEDIITGCSSIFELEREFMGDKNSIKKKLAVIDLSDENIFSPIHPLITHIKNNKQEWVLNHSISKILNPNTLIQKDGLDWDKNTSHTIWLIDDITKLPPVLYTHSSLIFALDSFNGKKLLKHKTGSDTDINSDTIIVTSSMINKNMQFMRVNRNRFIVP